VDSLLQPGTKLDTYEIRQLLGKGGMGEVYLAQDTRLGRSVAIKVLPPEVTKDHGRLRRFEQEARAASALNHPNIITIHEIGNVDSNIFIVTEFVEGKSLRELMQSGPIELTRVVDIATQIATALAAAQATGIVHRDIKPENVMIRSDGIVKVLDFGLAKLCDSAAAPLDPEAVTRDLMHTSPGVVMGTASYMSPEQAQGLIVDTRSDLWSLGVVLFDLVQDLRCQRKRTLSASGLKVEVNCPHQDRWPAGRKRRRCRSSSCSVRVCCALRRTPDFG